MTQVQTIETQKNGVTTQPELPDLTWEQSLSRITRLLSDTAHGKPVVVGTVKPLKAQAVEAGVRFGGAVAAMAVGLALAKYVFHFGPSGKK